MKSFLVFFCAAACLMLAACASVLPVPRVETGIDLPRTLHIVERREGEGEQDRLLVVQREEQTLRWSLYDLFGAPVARQILDEEGWRSDGLLPPNRAARELFAALLFAWTPRTQLDAAYGPDAWREDDNGSRVLLRGDTPYWSIEFSPEAGSSTFEIVMPEGLSWRVMPLEAKP